MTVIPGTMRAARLHKGQDGLAELRLDTDVPVPFPGVGEVLIRVRACGLNQVDLLTKDGQTPQEVPLHISREPRLPEILWPWVPALPTGTSARASLSILSSPAAIARTVSGARLICAA